MQKRNPEGRIIRKPVEVLIQGQIIDKCDPCNLHYELKYFGIVCSVYLYPEAKWRLGNCVMSTHTITRTKETDKFKRRVGQQKKAKVMK